MGFGIWRSCMSKMIILGLLSTLISTHIFSQDKYGGIKLGVNMSYLNSDGPASSMIERRTGYNLAATYSYAKTEDSHFGLTIEAGYSQKGCDFKSDTMSYKLHYITVPLLVDFLMIKPLKISIGPEVGYLSKAQKVMTDTSMSIMRTYNKRWDISTTVGVSYPVTFYMDVGLRYNKSFTRVANSDAVLNRRRLTNQYLQFYLTFKIVN